jgi:hypothetical protein
MRKSPLLAASLLALAGASMLSPQAASAQSKRGGIPTFIEDFTNREMGELKYLTAKIARYYDNVIKSSQNSSNKRSATISQYPHLNGELLDFMEKAESPEANYRALIEQFRLERAYGLEEGSGEYGGDYLELLNPLERGIIQYSSEEERLGLAYSALRELSDAFAGEGRVIGTSLCAQLGEQSPYEKRDLIPFSTNLDKVLNREIRKIPSMRSSIKYWFDNLPPTNSVFLLENSLVHAIFPLELYLVGMSAVKKDGKIRLIYPDNELSRMLPSLEYDTSPDQWNRMIGGILGGSTVGNLLGYGGFEIDGKDRNWFY